jgi:hypothetical protein
MCVASIFVESIDVPRPMQQLLKRCVAVVPDLLSMGCG